MRSICHSSAEVLLFCKNKFIGLKRRLVAQMWRRRLKTGKAEKIRKKQLSALREKDCISIVFQIGPFAKWKADSLLRLCISEPRFKPIIHLMESAPNDAEENELNAKRVREYAHSLGVPCYSFHSYDKLPQNCEADVIFIREPYDALVLSDAINAGLHKRPFCHIPYGFFAIGTPENMNNVSNNIALFNFYENKASQQLAASLMDNGGSNVRITGHTMADSFLFSREKNAPVWKNCGKPMKKIIWAPHWTINEGISWFASGNFLEIAEQMTALAEKYNNEIQFAFKPHPILYQALCNHPKWGKIKTDAYYRWWANMPNTQLEDGAYTSLFMQSDACIHDCGSFIIEYLFADKPAMFLVRGEGYHGYSDMAKEALKSYTKGYSSADIESFIVSVLREEDPFQNERGLFRERFLIPPNGCSAAQNIIDCLLGEGAYA